MLCALHIRLQCSVGELADTRTNPNPVFIYRFFSTQIQSRKCIGAHVISRRSLHYIAKKAANNGAPGFINKT